MCRVQAIGSLQSFGWCWLVTPVLLVACSLLPSPAPRLLSSFSSTSTTGRRSDRAVALGPRGVFLRALAGARGGLGSLPAYSVFEAAPAARRSTHGHGDGLEGWWAHADT